jgi:energy-coupling factor transporter ATP-binding protein EcfA2
VAGQDLVIFNWTVTPLVDLARQVAERGGTQQPAVVGIDGQSSSGKTTLATQLAGLLPGSSVLHTDDLAWHHGVFSWDRLLIDDVLPVVRSGAALSYRPPAWQGRGRPGAVELPGSLRWLVVEGVGASQPSVRGDLDVVLWVETDQPTRLARDAARVAAGEISADSYRGWMAEEYAYVVAHRPWEHADLIIDGREEARYDRDSEIVVAERWPERARGIRT